MYLKNIIVRNFRNHSDSNFEFGGKANILAGENGQGKTNVLEAISYLCLTKSFYSHGDSYALKIGNDLFEVEGEFGTERFGDQRVRVAYSEERKEKLYTVNKLQVEPLSSVIGKFPVVICSPEHAPITNQGPVERRRFIDLVISQSSSSYFQRLLEYRKILKNRNRILFDAKLQKNDPSGTIGPWDDQLISAGAYIMSRRQKFVDEFEPYINSSYSQMIRQGEKPGMTYLPSFQTEKDLNQNEMEEIFRTRLNDSRESDFRAGTTTVGPHRDELQFEVNGMDLRKYASQGQHKTFLVALKMAEFYFLKENCNEVPILLLDDIFSELDRSRASNLLGFVETVSQTFITSTNKDMFESDRGDHDARKVFLIRGGEVVKKEAEAA